MDIDKKRELKGTISLLDQAIAPLTLALGRFKEAGDEELHSVDEKDTSGRDLAHRLLGASKTLGAMADKLNQIKLWLEKA